MMRNPLVPLAALGLLLAAACASPARTAAPPPPPPTSASLPAPVTTTTTTPPRAPVALPTCDPVTVPPLDTKDFSAPTRIDNRWLPLVPGTRTVLEGRANRGGGVRPHRITFVVTDLTVVIDGVPNVVTWDVDVNNNQVSEAELAFFAQDNDGNVWNFGEYPETYENGQFTGAPSTWLAGVSDAVAGVQVPADRRTGKPEVLQGSAPAVEFLDCAKDLPPTGRICVPLGCYDDVRATEERSPLDPESGAQRKTYAAGVGSVQVTAKHDPEGETLVLIERTTLNPRELAAARQEVRKLDQHGRITTDGYRPNQPLQGP